MKKFSTTLQTALSKVDGLEAFCVVEIDWSTTFTGRYVDRPVAGLRHDGLIDIVGALNSSVEVSKVTDNQALSVTLIDTEGKLYAALRTTNPHRITARVYIFEATVTTDIVTNLESGLIFEGRLNSPISFDEGSRRLTVSILSRLETTEAGFSIDESQAIFPPEDLQGVAWPFCFGTCRDVPGLKLRSVESGTLAEPIGITDPFLLHKLQASVNLLCARRTGIGIDFGAGGGGLTYSESGEGGDITSTVDDAAYRASIKANTFTDFECLVSRCNIIETLSKAYTDQQRLEKTSIRIIGGRQFPQHQKIILEIDDAQFEGYFSNDVRPIAGSILAGQSSDIFRITRQIHPDLIGYPDKESYYTFLLAEAQRAAVAACSAERIEDLNRDLFPFGGGPLDPFNSALSGKVETAVFRSIGLGTAESYGDQIEKSYTFFNSIPSLDYFIAEAGSEVRLVTTGVSNSVTRPVFFRPSIASPAFQFQVGGPLTPPVIQVPGTQSVYVANILPSEVKYVKAYRVDEITGRRVLSTVHSDFYRVQISDYGSYQMAEIVFPIRLSLFKDGWEDEIFITLVSSVGPNTVDILRYLISKYTEYETDATFDTVRVQVDGFPMDFKLDRRDDVQTILQEIAYQARCSLTLRYGKYSISYLPEQPAFAYAGDIASAIPTITNADIDHQTLQLTYSDFNEVVTKYTVSWVDRYNLPKPYKIIIRNNVETYGLAEQTADFYCFTEHDLVRNAATFWMVRLSNIWTMLRFRTPVHKLIIETLDPVNCNIIVTDGVAPIVATGFVHEQNFDTGSLEVQWLVWLPILAGTTGVYRFVWPALLPAFDFWPALADINIGVGGAGNTPGVNASPPNFSPLAPINITVTRKKSDKEKEDELAEEERAAERKKAMDLRDEKHRQFLDKDIEKDEAVRERLKAAIDEQKARDRNRREEAQPPKAPADEGVKPPKPPGSPPSGGPPGGPGGEPGGEGSEPDPDNPQPSDDDPGPPDGKPPEGTCYSAANFFYDKVSVVQLPSGSTSSAKGVFGDVVASSFSHVHTFYYAKKASAIAAVQAAIGRINAGIMGVVGGMALTNANYVEGNCDDTNNDDIILGQESGAESQQGAAQQPVS